MLEIDLSGHVMRYMTRDKSFETSFGKKIGQRFERAQRAYPQRAYGKRTEGHEFEGVFRVFSGSVRVFSGCFQGVFPDALYGYALWTVPRDAIPQL